MFLQVSKISEVLELIPTVIISIVFGISEAVRTDISFCKKCFQNSLLTMISSVRSIESSALNYNKVSFIEMSMRGEVMVS